MTEDQIAELARLDEEAASAREASTQAQRAAMKFWVRLLVDEMQAEARRFEWTFENVVTQHYFGEQKLVLLNNKDTYFGQLHSRTAHGPSLKMFENVFNEELATRGAAIRLQTNGSWYDTIFVAA